MTNRCVSCGHKPHEHTEAGCIGGTTCKCKSVPGIDRERFKKHTPPKRQRRGRLDLEPDDYAA